MSEQSEVAGQRPYFGRIDALRGVGALTVAGYHFSGCVVHGYPLLQLDQWPSVAPFQQALARVGLFLMPGHAFLMAFFVISGFVLRLALEHGPQSAPAAIAKFILARLFRFYPIVAVAVIWSAIMFLDETAGFGATIHRLAANLLLLDVSLNPHLWALQVELLVIPMILALFFLEKCSNSFVVPLIALATTGLAFVPSWAGWRPLSINLFAFILGMTIPTVGRRFAMALSIRAANCVIFGSAVVLLTAGPFLGVYSQVTTVVEAYAAVSAISLVAYRQDMPLLKCLDGQRLQQIGSAAGSYYVLHMAMTPPLTALATWLFPATWSTHAPGAVGLSIVAVWLIVLIPVMLGASRLVEMPGIAMGRVVIGSILWRIEPQRSQRTQRKTPMIQTEMSLFGLPLSLCSLCPLWLTRSIRRCTMSNRRISVTRSDASRS